MTQQKIACPACDSYRSKVINSRPSEKGIYRRRECLTCGERFSTEETIKPYAQPRHTMQNHHKM